MTFSYRKISKFSNICTSNKSLFTTSGKHDSTNTCIGIGGDPIIGTTFREALELFAADKATRAIVLIGEIGGSAEEEAAAWAAEHLKHLPRVAFIAGRAAPEGRRMGHAGAIVSGASGRAVDKIAALEAAGFKVAGSPTELPRLLIEAGYKKA
mgnify:CR=1 FL=1